MIQSESDPNLQIDIYMRSETEKICKILFQNSDSPIRGDLYYIV